jgi:LmbE family N-acetylglucosaminyl deacetylase
MTPPIVILSPHFDDAVLSCWHVLSGPEEVRVVNVFAGVPPAGTPPGYWDRVGGRADPAGVVHERIEEDRRALALAGREAANLGFLDLQYRLAPQPHGELVEALRAELPADATVYAPGALGPVPDDARSLIEEGQVHPDHLAVRAAALELRAHGFEVVLYADLPHATAGGLPDWVRGDGGTARQREVSERWRRLLEEAGLATDALAGTVRALRGDDFARKLAAVRAYASQVGLIEDMFNRPVDDPELLGYEVEWRLPAPSSSASAA